MNDRFVMARCAAAHPPRKLARSRFAAAAAAVALAAASCTGSTSVGSNGGVNSAAELSSCERDRVAAALGVDTQDLILPLDPADEPIADIARDVCALDQSDPATLDGDSAPASEDDAAGLTPHAARDAALPANLVRAPAIFDPDDPPPGRDPVLDELWESCGAGSASACNALLYESAAGSDYEAYAFSCGGRENLHCSVLLGSDGAAEGLLAVDFDPQTPAPGNISELDGWWEACGDGSSRACAQLVLSAPGGSAYATFGWSCGGRTSGDCTTLLGDDGPPPALSGRSASEEPPGLDEYLDGLWNRCGALSAPACRDLATFGPPGSDYERFALSCGWRAVTPCARLFTELAT